MLSSLATGTYLENAALDAFLRDPRTFGSGPFVVSEFSLAEKTRLPWDRYRAFVTAVHALDVRYLRVPPVTQIITGNWDPRWRDPIDFHEIDVGRALDGRRIAATKLDELCDTLGAQFAERYGQLRSHWSDWIAKVESGEDETLVDPRPLQNRRKLVTQATLNSLGLDAPPSPSDPLPDRLRWTLRAWEMAMVFTRLDRPRDHADDLRNDPIDAMHYVLASTFCNAIATCDRGIRNIRQSVPSPRCPLLWVKERAAGVTVTRHSN